MTILKLYAAWKVQCCPPSKLENNHCMGNKFYSCPLRKLVWFTLLEWFSSAVEYYIPIVEIVRWSKRTPATLHQVMRNPRARSQDPKVQFEDYNVCRDYARLTTGACMLQSLSLYVTGQSKLDLYIFNLHLCKTDVFPGLVPYPFTTVE